MSIKKNVPIISNFFPLSSIVLNHPAPEFRLWLEHVGFLSLVAVVVVVVFIAVVAINHMKRRSSMDTFIIE